MPEPAAPQVDEVPELLSLAHPVLLLGSMYQLGTVQLAGMIGELELAAKTILRCNLQCHWPLGPRHAA